MDQTETVPKVHRMAKYKTMQSAFDFQADLAALGKVMGIESANEVAIILGLQIFKGIVLKTPVDTGRARANWMISEGAPVIAEAANAKPGAAAGSIPAATPPSVSAFKGGSAIFITNSLPYIVPLEYGHSKQAPAGMVRVTLAEVGAQASVATR
jgi:hypothetical protein